MRMTIANIAIAITPNKNNALLLLLKTSFISTNDIFKSSCVTLSFNGENPNKNPVITDAKIYNNRNSCIIYWRHYSIYYPKENDG